jgi:Tol biopolymer transport system component
MRRVWAGPVVALPLVVAVALVLVFARAGIATAAFGPASLLSGTPEYQFESADAPALASEGGYVAFQGSYVGVAGVWRRDAQTGAVEPVATAYDAEDPRFSAPGASLGAPDAAAPSISANGRYVAFTTTADLVPLHTGREGRLEGEPPGDIGCPEVYVRDMDIPASEQGAYTLASALEGGEGIAFAGGCPAHGGEGFAVAGAQAAPGVALSGNGQDVAFTVLSTSNLARGPGCAAGTPLGECPAETPASQVAVHDIETGATTLVSATPQGESTPGGGAYPSVEDEQHVSSTAESPPIGEQITGSSAAISADGGTVVWMGTDVPAQVPGSGPEITGSGACHGAAGSEVEPLWRRIGDGTGASTWRLLAGAGLDLFYHQSVTGEVVCAGSFVNTIDWHVFIPPVLSENGETVALVANAPRPEAVRSAELSEKAPTTDAYAVHVSDSGTPAPRVEPLTETLDYDETDAIEGVINDIAISPDGEHVAFEAARSEFTLPNLTLISPPLPTSEFRAQTYVANLHLHTLQRATVTYDGAEPTGSAGLLSLDGNGGAIAFASTAKNLFYGDAVGASQVYLARELPAEQPPATPSAGPIPSEPLLPEWRLDATATAQPNGSVIVYAQVPGAGQLAVSADAQLPAPVSHKAKRKGKSGGGKSATKRKSKGIAAGRAHAAGAGLLTRAIAHGTIIATAAAPVRLTLNAGASYRTLVSGRTGLYTVLHIAFTAPGHATLTEAIPVTFHRGERARATKGKAAKHSSKRKPAKHDAAKRGAR